MHALVSEMCLQELDMGSELLRRPDVRLRTDHVTGNTTARGLASWGDSQTEGEYLAVRGWASTPSGVKMAG